MNKFIIFKLTEVSPAGSSFSDDGTGIQVISTPVDGVAYMTAKLGSVNIFLKDVSPYEDNNLSTGESIQRSFVTVSCTEGSEVELIQKIASFGSSDKGNPFITFDATASSTFGGYGEDIKAFVKDHPVNRVTGEVSIITDNGFTASTANTVNDIDFGATANKPILDLDCRDATYSTGTLSAWANGGTGSSTYNVDIGNSVGTIGELTASETNGFNTNPVNLGIASYAVLANDLEISGDYTLYTVFSSAGGTADGQIGPLYGSSSAETVGLSATIEAAEKNPVVNNVIGVRHEGRVGLPVNATSTTPFDEDFPTVIVIRRDVEDNIVAYDYKGRVIASFTSNVVIPTDVDAGTKIIAENETGGNLKIKQIGSAGSNTATSFKGGLGRFGVVSRDIGSAASIKLAKDLHELYNL